MNIHDFLRIVNEVYPKSHSHHVVDENVVICIDGEYYEITPYDIKTDTGGIEINRLPGCKCGSGLIINCRKIED